jgi:hypothetical protein
MPGELAKVKAAAWGAAATIALSGLIVLGSRNLAHFDAPLVGYTFAVLFATFGVVYRYAMWLQRPPTALYWRKGWKLFLTPRRQGRNVVELAGRTVNGFVFNTFIWKRDWARAAAHMFIMWGCILAAAVTFPLVFGWVHFETVPGRLDMYQTYVFGFPGQTFPIESLTAFVIFHMLVWASFLVIAGVMLAMRRRMRDHGAAALQQFGEDFLPLIMLFAISVTGLMLTASYTWMEGYAFDFLAIIHAVTVIFTLLWMPFGKFFHIFMRPAQLGVGLYKDAGKRGEQARCRRCGEEYASRMHIEDLIDVERQLGYHYETDVAGVEHYQWICPRCRRCMPALVQARIWNDGPAGAGTFD